METVSVLQKSVFLFSTTYRILFQSTDASGEVEDTKTYTADGQEDHGDGIQCTAAHSTVPIFGFAEIVAEPKLFVKSFPSFGTVTILRNPEAQSYLSMCFSGTDYLIALSGINTFSLEVWNWRTSQLLGIQNTGVLSVQQSIW